jgi:two-component system OmpR family sensor kinase
LLLVLALVALGVVRRGLRPLDVIAATATAITAGERGRRIPFASSESEVGRVSEALNRMLDENESALAAKEASEERMRRFVADASHELRTPLASIRSYADLLASGAAATPADRSLALERIQAEAVRMTRLVEDLLLLARLDMGRPLARGPVDVASIARAAVADFGAIDPSRRVTLEAAAGAVVDGDRDRLHQVLANLLANARQHTPPGTRVEVRVDAAADEVVVQVRDHGPGLPDEQAVFDPFYRADPARRRHGSVGVGLGLPIVAAIVRAHGGTVTARNEPSGGAVFVVRLPVDRQPAAERVPAAEPVPVASG